jgi:hypothetical protein
MFGKEYVRVLARVVSANAVKTAPPKNWLKIAVEIPVAASIVGRPF